MWQIALACYWLALFIATHVPSDIPVPAGSGIDKLVHAAAFAGLAAILAVAWQAITGQRKLHHLLWAWLALILYAALDERTQILVGRHGTVTDWLADAAGAAIGLTLFAWLRAKNA